MASDGHAENQLGKTMFISGQQQAGMMMMISYCKIIFRIDGRYIGTYNIFTGLACNRHHRITVNRNICGIL